MFSPNILPIDKSCPCFKCTAETGRTATCKFDGSCGKYLAWKSKHDAKQEVIRKNKAVDDGFFERGMNIRNKNIKNPHPKQQRGW